MGIKHILLTSNTTITEIQRGHQVLQMDFFQFTSMHLPLSKLHWPRNPLLSHKIDAKMMPSWNRSPIFQLCRKTASWGRTGYLVPGVTLYTTKLKKKIIAAGIISASLSWQGARYTLKGWRQWPNYFRVSDTLSGLSLPGNKQSFQGVGDSWGECSFDINLPALLSHA